MTDQNSDQVDGTCQARSGSSGTREPIGDIIAHWAQQHRKAKDIGKETRLARSALERIGAVLRDDPNESVRLMKHLADLHHAGGDAAIAAHFRAQVTAGMDVGFDWSAADEPDWLVDGWLLNGRAQGLYGDGEVGKSRLGMQLAYCLAAAEPLLLPSEGKGIPIQTCMQPEPKRVLSVSWEVTRASATRLFRGAAALYGHDADRQAAAAERMLPVYARGMGPLWLAGATASSPSHPTSVFEWLREELPRYDLCILDPVAAAFAADENKRADVRAFLNALDQLAVDAQCAILLIGHSSAGKLVSGSTDWLNQPRVVLAMQREKVKEGKAGTMLKAVKMNDVSKPGIRWLKSHPQGGWLSVSREESQANG